MKTLLLAVLLISGLPSQTPADGPRNADEKHYDDSLNALMQQIAADPAFALYFVGGKVLRTHDFERRADEGAWLDSRTVKREMKEVPASPGMQVASLLVTDSDHGIWLAVFVQKGQVVMGPSRVETFHIANQSKLELAYDLIVKDKATADRLRKRLDSLIRASDFQVSH